MTMQTSFQKKGGNRIPYIPGTKPSIQNAQLLVSSGVPSFDGLIGGGIPVGGLTLIEEDTYGIFSKLLAKYFLAEGVISQHELFVATQDSSPKQLIEELPAPLEASHSREYLPVDDKMCIAWRYQNLPPVEASQIDSDFGHNYDITQIMDVSRREKININYWDGLSEPDLWEGPADNSYTKLLNCIIKIIKEGKFHLADNPKKRNILRIGILNLGSPLWGTNYPHLFSFLYSLRALLRSAYSVCMITMPTYLFEKVSVINRCQHISDVAVKLESFSGSDRETNPVFKDYHGLFHINKLPAINSLANHIPESFDLAFKLRRKRFSIETLHLPPELQETTQREQDEFNPLLVGGNLLQRKIDF